MNNWECLHCFGVSELGEEATPTCPYCRTRGRGRTTTAKIAPPVGWNTEAGGGLLTLPKGLHLHFAGRTWGRKAAK